MTHQTINQAAKEAIDELKQDGSIHQSVGIYKFPDGTYSHITDGSDEEIVDWVHWDGK